MAEWVNKDNKKVMYVEVTAEGNSLDEARLSALQIAVERAVGVIVASESEARNQKLYRDEILTYASGFVEDYKIVDQVNRGSSTWVKIQVWVKHSSLRDRLLSQSRASGQIEGGRLAAQIESFQNSRQNGDRLLAAVLADYPSRAFHIEIGKTSVVVDPQRKTLLQISFSIAWSTHYIKSLEEAVQIINQRPECGGWFSACNNLFSIVSVGSTTAYFEDSLVYDLFWKETIAAQPRIKLSLLDPAGNVISAACYEYPSLTYSPYPARAFLDIFEGRIQVTAHQRARSTLSFQLDRVPIKDLNRVDLQVVRLKSCPKERY